MKRFLILLSLMFCTVALAENITINWGVNEQLYTTTTCEIGGDVILPSVSKRGHVFRGWVAEHFNRGTFSNLSGVPSINTGYTLDVYDNYTPKKNDYITVTDASDYFPCDKKFIITATQANEGSTYFKNVTVTYQNKTYEYNGIRTGQTIGLSEIPVKIISTSSNWQYVALQDIIYNGVVYHNGDVFFSNGSWWFNYIYTTANTYFNQISGTWKFVYDGKWETDGVCGWKPDYQIVSE